MSGRRDAQIPEIAGRAVIDPESDAASPVGEAEIGHRQHALAVHESLQTAPPDVQAQPVPCLYRDWRRLLVAIGVFLTQQAPVAIRETDVLGTGGGGTFRLPFVMRR